MDYNTTPPLRLSLVSSLSLPLISPASHPGIPSTNTTELTLLTTSTGRLVLPHGPALPAPLPPPAPAPPSPPPASNGLSPYNDQWQAHLTNLCGKIWVWEGMRGRLSRTKTTRLLGVDLMAQAASKGQKTEVRNKMKAIGGFDKLLC